LADINLLRADSF